MPNEIKALIIIYFPKGIIVVFCDFLMYNIILIRGKYMWELFHFHKWIYTEAELSNDNTRRLGIALKPATRTCIICKKQQYKEKHCLGLNPPEYVTNWFNMEKLNGQYNKSTN